MRSHRPKPKAATAFVSPAAKGAGAIEIVRGNALKPFAVYVSNGAGGLSRADYATAREARGAAAELKRATGWAITDRLGERGTGPQAPHVASTAIVARPRR